MYYIIIAIKIMPSEWSLLEIYPNSDIVSKNRHPFIYTHNWSGLNMKHDDLIRTHFEEAFFLVGIIFIFSKHRCSINSTEINKLS